jgi:RNA polymerase sigma-70 factor (ECF subfamily)
MPDEDQLIRSAIAGDNTALQSLLLIHYADIEATIRQNLGSRLAAKVEVQDLMQDVLTAVYQEIGRFTVEESGSFRGWLKRVTTNRVIDAARRFRRAKRGGEIVLLDNQRLAAESLDDVWNWVVSDSNPPDRPARRREAREAVQVCLARLPADQRAAVVAYYFEHRDARDIAVRLDRSPGAVRELLRRARANLAKDLGAASKWLSAR